MEDDEGTPKTNKAGKVSKGPKAPKPPKEPAQKAPKAGKMKIPKAAAPKGIKAPHAHLKTPNPGNLFKGKRKK